jgi:hypothetical protein
MPWISLFPTVKTAALYLVPIKSYSKNTHTPSFLKWVIGRKSEAKSTSPNPNSKALCLLYP